MVRGLFLRQLKIAEFRSHAHELVDWMATTTSSTSNNGPWEAAGRTGDILGKLPSLPPVDPEDFHRIFGDFTEIIPARV